jgi:hypothetical protein
MLFETVLLGGFLYMVGTGQNVRAAARTVGAAVGRASGSLRRARAEVDRVQRKVGGVGGEGIRQDSQEVAERMRRLRAIQLETMSLLSISNMVPQGTLGLPGAAPPPPFSEEEVAVAVKGSMTPTAYAATAATASATASAAATSAATSAALAPAPTTDTAQGGGMVASPPTPSTVVYYHGGKPVVQATFESVWDAGTSVPRGLKQEDVAEAIRQGKDLSGFMGEGTPNPPIKKPPPLA